MGGYWYSKLESQKCLNATLLLDYSLSKRIEAFTSAAYPRAMRFGAGLPCGGAAPLFANGIYIGSRQSSSEIRIGISTLPG
jgi:hypothetical protein